MDIQVLGVPRVTENGVPIKAATPEAGHLLAALAVSPDRVVPEAVLADELAHRTSTRYHHAVLHAAVRRLRERLAEALGAGSVRTPETVLSARPGGYVLDTGGGRSDVRQFEREAGAWPPGHGPGRLRAGRPPTAPRPRPVDRPRPGRHRRRALAPLPHRGARRRPVLGAGAVGRSRTRPGTAPGTAAGTGRTARRRMEGNGPRAPSWKGSAAPRNASMPSASPAPSSTRPCPAALDPPPRGT